MQRVTTFDAGLAVVQHLFEAFQPEPAHVSKFERGFQWWPARLGVRVSAEPARTTGGFETFRVQVETRLVHALDGHGEPLAAIARWNTRDLGLSAARWDAESGALSLRASVYVHAAEWEPGAQRLAHAALLQLAAAHRAIEQLLPELQAEPADSAREGSLPRTEPDALCEAWRAYAERGGAPSPWDASAFQRVSAIQPPPTTKSSW